MFEDKYNREHGAATKIQAWMRGYWGRQEFQERKRQRHLELIDERRARRAKAMANALHHVSMAGAMNLAEMRAIEQRSKLEKETCSPTTCSVQCRENVLGPEGARRQDDC